jgi:hypothetical protein
MILVDIRALEEEFFKFERKYGIRSETFYAGYISGEELEQDRWLSNMVDPLGKVPITVFCIGYQFHKTDNIPPENLCKDRLHKFVIQVALCKSLGRGVTRSLCWPYQR